jgi:protein tyrosine phosphatase (PTP) superfamily phosphohydrolase (DUF442 family)
MLSDIVNFYEIHSNLFTAGQPEPEQFPVLKEAGVELVINLVPASSTDAVQNEQEIVRALGIDYIHIPVIWTDPTRSDLDQFMDALDLNRDRKVFAHCVVNYRVSAFLFLYRVLRLGIPPETARQSMREIWEPDNTWENFITGVLDANRTAGH